MGLVCCSGNTDRSLCVDLTDRESSVCATICESQQPISFSQLKRDTQLHQEILSRIVRRLVVHGVVRKSDDGRYRSAFK